MTSMRNTAAAAPDRNAVTATTSVREVMMPSSRHYRAGDVPSPESLPFPAEGISWK
jgi:hypothetical protein